MTVLLLLLLGVIVGLGIERLAVRLALSPEAIPTPAARPGTTLTAAPADADGRVEQWSGNTFLHVAIPSTTAALFALAGARYHEPVHLALATAYIAVLVTCASTDLLAYRVPNAITYPAIVLALAAGLAMPDAHPVDVLTGGALAGAVLLIPALLTRGQGIGMGDVKLALFVGLALGFSLTPAALLVTALLGGLTAATLLVFGLRRRRDVIPYAPFLAAGALTLLLWHGGAFAGAI